MEITKKFPETERYDLTTQVRRCSKSVPSNIAEGWGRQSNEEFKTYFR
jgi:four helix bundle protein